MGLVASVKKKIKNNKLIGNYAVSWYKIFKDMRKQSKNKNFCNRASYAKYWKNTNINEHQVLYEAFFGRGMLCNPYAIFLALLEDPRAKDMQHIWVLDDPADHQILIEQYKNNPNVSFVQYNSDEYRKVLCTAKYLVNNVTFPNWFTKKEGQVYINTWHGIPLKTLGYDMPNGKTEVSNTIRNFLHADYLLSTSPNLSKTYRSAFKLDNVFSGQIVEEGYPRLDTLFRFTREEILEKLHRYGVEVDPAKKILLYAPTWRGDTYGTASADVSEYFTFKEEMESYIDTNKYQILIKVHQRVYQLCKDELVGGFFVPATIDANEILSVTDVLITDFSSIYFDFLATNRPVLFYIPDLEDYREQRDMYKDLSQLPGPVTTEKAEIANWINNIDDVSLKWQDAYQKEKEWSGAVSDGQIANRIINGIFFDDHNLSVQILPVEKTKILFILAGGLRVNGICSSLLNLLNSFDYGRFDVSLMIRESPEKEGQKRIDEIPSEVRVFYRNSTFNMTKWEYFQYIYQLQFGIKRLYSSKFRREYIRSYGRAEFDYVLDFEGYNRFFSLMALQDQNAKTGIWMHNDMSAECEMKYPELSSIFKMYPSFDFLISCSKEIMEVNRKNLADSYHIGKDKFHYAKNFIDTKRLNLNVNKDLLINIGGTQRIAIKYSESYGCNSLKTAPYIPDKDEFGKRNFRFVNVGRMSPEKNQLNLVEAFDKLHQENPNTYLYIIGDGPLKSDIQKKIRSLKSKDSIILTGNIGNPFAVMKCCDCFVLPSLHEGQPITVHEARALHMPIIMSNFSSVAGASLKNGQMIIGMGVKDIYKGLKAFTKGKVPCNYVFDPKQYNREAWKEFLVAIEDI